MPSFIVCPLCFSRRGIQVCYKEQKPGSSTRGATGKKVEEDVPGVRYTDSVKMDNPQLDGGFINTAGKRMHQGTVSKWYIFCLIELTQYHSWHFIPNGSEILESRSEKDISEGVRNGYQNFHKMNRLPYLLVELLALHNSPSRK